MILPLLKHAIRSPGRRFSASHLVLLWAKPDPGELASPFHTAPLLCVEPTAPAVCLLGKATNCGRLLRRAYQPSHRFSRGQRDQTCIAGHRGIGVDTLMQGPVAVRKRRSARQGIDAELEARTAHGLRQRQRWCAVSACAGAERDLQRLPRHAEGLACIEALAEAWTASLVSEARADSSANVSAMNNWSYQRRVPGMRPPSSVQARKPAIPGGGESRQKASIVQIDRGLHALCHQRGG